MYAIPDSVMERLLRDLDGAKAHLNFVLSRRYSEETVDARNNIANVRDELASYRAKTISTSEEE